MEKIFLLKKLINGGTSDYDFQDVCIATTYEKCVEVAKKCFQKDNDLTIEDVILTKENRINNDTITFVIEDQKKRKSNKFYIWITELV